MAGGGKKGGKLGLPQNGFLRYCLIYVLALVLIVAAIAAGSGGLLARFGLGGNNTVVSNAATQPDNDTTASTDLAPQTGGSSPSGQVADAGVNTAAGSAAAAPPLSIQGEPVPSNQAGLIIPYRIPEFVIVQPGDTLQALANTFGTTPSALMSYNGLTSANLVSGQVLYLPEE